MKVEKRDLPRWSDAAGEHNGSSRVYCRCGVDPGLDAPPWCQEEAPACGRQVAYPDADKGGAGSDDWVGRKWVGVGEILAVEHLERTAEAALEEGHGNRKELL